MASPDAVIFDAYGTLLDVHSAMARHAAALGPDWQQISRDWRTKQIEYTWVRSLVGPDQHVDFATLTDEALAVVAAQHRIADPALIAELRAAYRALDAYPEVPAMLDRLRAAGRRRGILSNGEPAMLAEGVAAAGIAQKLDFVLSVETVGVFKPAQAVYRMACDHLSLPPGRIAFLSSNPWDAYGAAVFGFRVLWVNRTGQPEEYGLHARAEVLRDLAGLPDLLA